MLSKLRTELCIADERHEELRQRLDAGEERPWVKCGPQPSQVLHSVSKLAM